MCICRILVELEDLNSIVIWKVFFIWNEIFIFNKLYLVWLLLSVGNLKYVLVGFLGRDMFFWFWIINYILFLYLFRNCVG